MICRKIMTIGLLAFSTVTATAQEASGDNALIEAEQMPYFKGCQNMPDGSVEKRTCSNDSLIAYIAQNLETPPNTEASGVVYVRFFVSDSGKVEGAFILRGLTKAHDDAALKVVRNMPNWEAGRQSGKSVKVQMTLPIRFKISDESEFSNGFQMTWGTLKGKNVGKKDVEKHLATPITVRDEEGNALEINEIMFERDRKGKFIDAHSNGTITDDMRSIVRKLKSGDVFTITATVQRKGQFFYVEKSYTIEN